MKLLICTQAVDSADPTLGFFVEWIRGIAVRCERVEVICLREGAHDLPANVRVHALGKGRLARIVQFKYLAWRLRHEYDAVFVHMNQEYILIAGLLWKLLGKRIYLWRNHYAGSWLTDLAAAFCTHVFCTSKYSYTAKYKKTILMPVGVDTARFTPDERIERTPHSILFLARLAPAKRPEMLLRALAELARGHHDFTASFVGSPLPRDAAYAARLADEARSLGIADRVSFLPAVSNSATIDLYRQHDIFVNCSPSGMFDKTLFEAAACGCRVFASSKDFSALAGAGSYFDSSEELARALTAVLAASASEREQVVRASMELAERESLMMLVDRLVAILQ